MEPAAMAKIDGPEALARQFNVSRETVAKLVTYVDLLNQWQKTINLVSPATLPDVWHRHIADSAQLLTLAPPDARVWIDLGSGAGLPGLVVAILTSDQPGTRVTLVESDARKVAFLREVARRTGLNQSSPPGHGFPQPQTREAAVDICDARIETASTHVRVGTGDVVTARALAPLPKLLGLCLPYCRPETVVLLPKGRDAGREVGEAKAYFEFQADLVPSLTDRDARIVVGSNLHARGK